MSSLEPKGQFLLTITPQKLTPFSSSDRTTGELLKLFISALPTLQGIERHTEKTLSNSALMQFVFLFQQKHSDRTARNPLPGTVIIMGKYF